MGVMKRGTLLLLAALFVLGCGSEHQGASRAQGQLSQLSGQNGVAEKLVPAAERCEVIHTIENGRLPYGKEIEIKEVTYQSYYAGNNQTAFELQVDVWVRDDLGSNGYSVGRILKVYDAFEPEKFYSVGSVRRVGLDQRTKYYIYRATVPIIKLYGLYPTIPTIEMALYAHLRWNGYDYYSYFSSDFFWFDY